MKRKITVMITAVMYVTLAFLSITEYSTSLYAQTSEQNTETVKIASYNIEHFMKKFDQILMPERSQERTELWRDEEDLYEIARTITLERLDADVIGIQECCSEEMLKLFNEKWLDNRYGYVKVFPGNVEGQYIGIMAKPGWVALRVSDQYYLEADPMNDPEVAEAKRSLAGKNRLFSRGPGFVLFRSPGGHNIWVGCTHVKSKYGNSKAVTRWRIRELERTREICRELAAEPETSNLIMLGDFNDDFGRDRYEKLAGQDAIAVMLKKDDGEALTCTTMALLQQDNNPATYHCEIKPPTYRSFIDHIFVSPALSSAVKNTVVIDDPIAAAASDHYPVVTTLELGGKKRHMEQHQVNQP